MSAVTSGTLALPVMAEAFDLPEQEIMDAAERAADSVQRLANQWQQADTPQPLVMRTLRRIARQHKIDEPAKSGFRQWMNRMTDKYWWRRSLRKRLRVVEAHQIQRGAVHRRASAYASHKALTRFERNRKRQAALLQSLEACNQSTGEVIPLQDLIDASLSNPENRRKAMMARVKGVEARAKVQGHVALFLTITCPSRMHPRHASGAPNERHDGTTPRQAQTYLGRLWNRAMRQAAHQGVSAYGLRVVEPHHDACPHWHVLVFVKPEHGEAFASLMRSYALADNPSEPGAAEHRFTVEHIDPAKGSAVGYLAKYVSKSIDGEGVDADDETGQAGGDASRRIVAWARTWGIRQFQFFGVPPITPTRELYRVDGDSLPGQALRDAHAAAKANDYAAWLDACEMHGLRFKVQYSERQSTRYAEETTRAIQGLRVQVQAQGQIELVTRSDTWRIQPRKASDLPGQSERAKALHAFPWTRFNNSASIDSKGFFESGGDA